MRNLTVLITGAGAPGIKGTIYSLKNNFDKRRIKTVGVDIKKDVVGRYLCDAFYQIPRPSDDAFIPTLLHICKKEKVDVILPQVTDELLPLSEHKGEFEEIGTKVAISERDAILRSNNKYELMKVASELKLPVTKFYLVNNFKELKRCAENLGWPEKLVVVKPPVSSGMRGFRIITESIDRKSTFFGEKPSETYVKMNELKSILGDSFPDLLVTEFLSGMEYTVDLLTADTTTVIPRTRDLIRTGITFNGTVEKNEEIIQYSRKLSKKLNLKYAYGFQFKLDDRGVPKIIECNPRVQGTMVLSTLAGANIIYGAVKYALGEEVPRFRIRWGTRLLRYWGGIGVYKERIVGEII